MLSAGRGALRCKHWHSTMVAYHGTDLGSATNFLNGAPLDAALANARKIDGPPGFFLATALPDAEFFGVRRGQGVVIRFQFSPEAVRRLAAAGMMRRPIPRGPRSPWFVADELYVPPSAFDTFNRLRQAGEIRLSTP